MRVIMAREFIVPGQIIISDAELDIPWVKKQVKDIGYKVLSYESKPYEKKEKKGFFHFGKK